MLRSVQIRNESGTTLESFPIGIPGPEQNYFIRKVDGLGPTDAILSMSNFSGYDGGLFHAARSSQRQIILTIGYSPDYSQNKNIATLRKALYKVFPPKRKIRVYVYDSEVSEIWTYGYVEKTEPNVFSNNPELIVTINCESAYFSSVEPVSLNTNTSTLLNLSNYGDAPTSLYIDMTVQTQVDYLRIINNVQPDILFMFTFMVGDRVQISTEPGMKYATVTRGGSTIRLLDNMTVGSLDLTIEDRVTAWSVRLGQYVPNPYQLIFTPKWLGA